MSRYAKDTSVSVEKSEAEIKSLLRKYGASAIVIGEMHRRAQIAFEMRERRIVMRMVLPDREDPAFLYTAQKGLTRSSDAALASWEQACRQRWRAFALCIKAKLEAVESGIETFDEAFLAHVMLPTGETMGEWAARPENLRAALGGGTMPPLLPGPRQ